MWAQLQDINAPQKRGRTAAAPPLSKGMWAVYCRSTEDWGKEKHKGGPRKWEARAVRLENEPRRLSWLVFSKPSFHPIPLTALVPNASVSNDDVTGDHPNNEDANPTEGLAAVRRGEPSHRMATTRTMAATTIA